MSQSNGGRRSTAANSNEASSSVKKRKAVVIDPDDTEESQLQHEQAEDEDMMAAVSPPSKRPKRLASLRATESIMTTSTRQRTTTTTSAQPSSPSTTTSSSPLPSIKLFFTMTPSTSASIQRKAVPDAPTAAHARSSEPSILFFTEPAQCHSSSAQSVSRGAVSPSRISCDACGIVITSSCFSCDPCRFDICLRCALPFDEKRAAQISYPGHPHRLTQHQPASQSLAAPALPVKPASGAPTYSIFDKKAWGSKKTATKQQDAEDLLPTLKPGEKPPEFFLSASERQQLKQQKRREAILRETQEAHSQLKAAFAASAPHPFLLPNENYARSLSPSAIADQEPDPFGKQLPLFPLESHIRQLERSVPWSPATDLEESTPNISLDTTPTFFSQIPSHDFIEESSRVLSTGSQGSRGASCALHGDELSEFLKSKIVFDRLQMMLGEQALLLKTQHSPKRRWADIDVFDSQPFLKLAYLAEMPDPGVFDQPDTPYEIGEALSLFSRVASARQDALTQAQLWTFKYRPRTFSDVCGHKNWASFVHAWLAKWRDAMLDPEQRLSQANSRVSHEDDFSFSGQEDEDSLSATSTMARAMLIPGPIGAGKTSAIYACANQLNYNIIEINPSSDRSGQQIKNLFGEATQSHRASAAPNPKPVAGKSSQANNADNGLTLILFDEVDNLFPEHDKGFFQALGKLLDASKRPIILTCESDRIPRELQNRSEIVPWPMRATPEWSVFFFLNLVLLAEVPTGQLSLSASDAQHLADLSGCDIRRCLLALQMSVQTSSFASLVEQLAGLSTCLSNPASFWQLFRFSQSWALENLILSSEITPVLFQPRRLTKYRAREKAPALMVHLNWLSLFGTAAWSRHDSLFVVDHDPFIFPDEESDQPQQPQTSTNIFSGLLDGRAVADQDAFIDSKLGHPCSAAPFCIPRHRLPSEVHTGMRLFDHTVGQVADAFSLFDLCTTEIGSASIDTEQPGPFQKHNEMASAYLAKAIVASVSRSEGAGALPDNIRHSPSWAPKPVEEVIISNLSSSSAALYKFIPPTVTSRALQRDYLPHVLRMSFIEDKRKQHNNKRRFQERLQLKSAAVTSLEVGLLGLLSQPAGFPAPLVPIDLT